MTLPLGLRAAAASCCCVRADPGVRKRGTAADMAAGRPLAGRPVVLRALVARAGAGHRHPFHARAVQQLEGAVRRLGRA